MYKILKCNKELAKVGAELKRSKVGIEDQVKEVQEVIETIIKAIKVNNNQSYKALVHYINTNVDDMFKELMAYTFEYNLLTFNENLILANFHINNYEGLEALKFLMYGQGVMFVCENTDIYTAETVLKYMLPISIKRALPDNIAEVTEEELQDIEENKDVEECINHMNFWNEFDSGYLYVQVLNYAFNNLSNYAIGYIANNVDTENLALSMFGLCSRVKKNIFRNLSEDNTNKVVEIYNKHKKNSSSNIVNAMSIVTSQMLEFVTDGKIDAKKEVTILLNACRYDYYNMYEHTAYPDRVELGSCECLMSSIDTVNFADEGVMENTEFSIDDIEPEEFDGYDYPEDEETSGSDD